MANSSMVVKCVDGLGDDCRCERTGAVEVLARSERFELPTLGIEIRCSIQLSYERITFQARFRTEDGYRNDLPALPIIRLDETGLSV
jgi:hypothetical protein